MRHKAVQQALEDLYIESEIPGCGCSSCQSRYLVDERGLSEEQAREIISGDGLPFSEVDFNPDNEIL
jgi:hypothetical protein